MNFIWNVSEKVDGNIISVHVSFKKEFSPIFIMLAWKTVNIIFFI